jgi:uncharacterized protein YegP (UPF0339 family)
MFDSKFHIFKGVDGQFYYHLTAPNHEKILSGEGYKTKRSCEDGIASVKSNAPYDFRYERKASSDGKFYFILKASNGETIGKSELYNSTFSRDGGIDSVKRNAPKALVVTDKSAQYA